MTTSSLPYAENNSDWDPEDCQSVSHQLLRVVLRQHRGQQGHAGAVIHHPRQRLFRIRGHHRPEAGSREGVPHGPEHQGNVVRHQNRSSEPPVALGAVRSTGGFGVLDRREGENQPRPQALSVALGPDAASVEPPLSPHR